MQVCVAARDYGPANKLLGMLHEETAPRTRIVIVDDDWLCNRDLLENLEARFRPNERTAIGLSGARLPRKWSQIDVRMGSQIKTAPPLPWRLTFLAEPAEDIAVEVYAQIWKQAADYNPARGSALTWLLTVTRSRAVDLRRARRRDRATEPLDPSDEIESDRPGPEALSASAERRRFVQRALATLTAELRQVVELSFFAGLSHSEIASQLGQPLGTVKTRIRSAMIQLRAQLAPLHGSPLSLEDD